MNSDYDILIVGGGMVGLALGQLLAEQDLAIAIIDSNPAPTKPANAEQLRVSAISRASQNLLTRLGVWNDTLLANACAYDSMHVWDDSAGGELHFEAAALGEPDIGHIIPNDDIQYALWQQLEQQQQVHLLAPLSLKEARWADNKVVLTSNDGHTLTGRLAVAADGAHSWLRQQSHLHTDHYDYDHHAIVASVQCELPHQHCARQSFLDTGPLALLPLRDDHHCSIVWSTSPQQAERLLADTDEAFNIALREAFGPALGELTLTSQRVRFPLTSRHVSEYVSDGLALVGDAAHTIHPLAGQGVNLGFMDAASLAQTISANLARDRSISSKQALRPYERWRRSENQLVIDGMYAIKTLFAKQPEALERLRSWGMNQINDRSFIKRQMIKIAMGLEGDLPEISRPPKPNI